MLLYRACTHSPAVEADAGGGAAVLPTRFIKGLSTGFSSVPSSNSISGVQKVGDTVFLTWSCEIDDAESG